MDPSLAEEPSTTLGRVSPTDTEYSFVEPSAMDEIPSPGLDEAAPENPGFEMEATTSQHGTDAYPVGGLTRNGSARSRQSRSSEKSSSSRGSTISSISAVPITEEEVSQRCDETQDEVINCYSNAVWSIFPALLVTVVGVSIILCVAFEVLSDDIQQFFFLGLYVVAVLGMLLLLVLHGCGKLTTGMGEPDKKRSFTLGGILILGSGGMIYQSLSLYSVAILFSRCHKYQELVMMAVDLFVSGLQVLFLVKFLSVRINRSVAAVAISRFVLIHVMATNLCLWFQTIITESLHEIHLHDDYDYMETDPSPELTSIRSVTDTVTLPSSNDTIAGNETMNESILALFLTSEESGTGLSRCSTASEVASLVAPYTYPLLIEFSVLAAGLFLSIWEQTATKHPDKHTSADATDSCQKVDPEGYEKSQKSDTSRGSENVSDPQSVSYHNSGEGLFMGWIIILGTIVFVIIFTYESYRDSRYSSSFGMAVYGSHAFLSGIQLVTVLYTAVRMNTMKKHEEEATSQEKREKHLLTICFLSVMVYKVFCVVIGFVNDEIIIMIDGFLTIAASTAQTAFINWFASHKCLAGSEQRRYKPGRQGLELLRWTNVALWLVNTFLLRTAVAKSPLEDTIGVMTWIITSNIVQPLTILYYFHSVMCIATIIAEVHSR